MTGRRHEKPLRRVNPSGEVVWVARYTGRDRKRRSAGTFELKREAQAAIDVAYDVEFGDGPVARDKRTVGAYAETWTRQHPRSDRTDKTNEVRLRAVLDVRVGGRRLRDWPMREVAEAEIVELLDHMLRVQGRAAEGARGVLRTLSAMWQDAIVERVATRHPVKGIRVRAADPRVRKPPRRIRVWSWEQMREFSAALPMPGMGRAMSDCGLRLGEMLALERSDVMAGGCGDPGCELAGVAHVHVRRTAHEGRVEAGTKTTRGRPEDGRVVPLGPGLLAVLAAMPPRLDSKRLFPSPRGGPWHERNFYRDVWALGRVAVPAMAAATPHEFRHSFVTHMRAAGVDPADLAAWTGHTVLTATTVYTHSTGASLPEFLAGLPREGTG
jgi:integrase